MFYFETNLRNLNIFHKLRKNTFELDANISSKMHLKLEQMFVILL